MIIKLVMKNFHSSLDHYSILKKWKPYIKRKNNILRLINCIKLYINFRLLKWSSFRHSLLLRQHWGILSLFTRINYWKNTQHWRNSKMISMLGLFILRHITANENEEEVSIFYRPHLFTYCSLIFKILFVIML